MKKLSMFFLSIFFLITVFCINSGCFAVNSEKIQIITTSENQAKQGETFFIKIKSEYNLKNPVFKFKNKTYNIFKTKKNEYTGLLGINTLEKPGRYKISIYDKTGKLNDKIYISVIKKDYPSQNIRVTKGMASLRATAHELNLIGKAKRTLSHEKLRTSPPYNSPTDGCINSVFGLRRFYNGKFSGNYHKGVDIKSATGETVRTITDGRVIFAEGDDKFRLHGGSVAIDHGQGLMSLYIHLSKITVKEGEMVKANQKIGEVGMSGFATGPHLHWGLYVNGTPVDPMQGWIKPVNLCK